jgi:hypothetical protein
MSNQAKFKLVNKALIEAVPELRDRYEREIAGWGEEMGPHVIYGDVLNPYLVQLLDAPEDPGNTDILRRVFDFLERLLANSDPDFADVARTTVAEELEADSNRLQRARPFMGPLMARETRERLPYRRPRRPHT